MPCMRVAGFQLRSYIITPNPDFNKKSLPSSRSMETDGSFGLGARRTLRAPSTWSKHSARTGTSQDAFR